jgi:hypothetical protein
LIETETGGSVQALRYFEDLVRSPTSTRTTTASSAIKIRCSPIFGFWQTPVRMARSGVGEIYTLASFRIESISLASIPAAMNGAGNEMTTVGSLT